VKYACIARHQREFPVRLMCRVLIVQPGSYYAWRRRSPSRRASEDLGLLRRVRDIHAMSDGTYGAPRIRQELRAQGIAVSQKRIARLMRADGLVGRRPKGRRVQTTDATHAFAMAPNRLNRQFAVTAQALNRAWVSDLTYVPTREGWLFLAIVLDLASRRVIGWAMRTTVATDLTLSALRMALQARRPAPGLLHHSDRGVQYACTEYRTLLAAHGAEVSMSRPGNCWDNAVAESFFATLELELIQRHDWHTREEARAAIFRYIETWYNGRRRHSTLHYLSPAAYERQLETAA